MKLTKKQRRNLGIIFLVIAIIGVLFLTGNLDLSKLVIAGDEARINIVGIWSERPSSFNLLKPFVITTGKQSYNPGETITATVGKEMDAYCSLDTIVQLDFLSSFGFKKATASKSLGSGGAKTIYTQFTIQTSSDISPGTYKVQYKVFCDGVLIGDDGFKGTTWTASQNTKELEIIGEEEITPPPKCNLQCGLGHKLIDNYPQCYCQQQFTVGNGICEIGETSTTSKDCERKECSKEEIFTEGGCFPKEIICKQAGGTKECKEDKEDKKDKEDGGGFSFNIMLLLGAGLIGLGFWINSRRKG